MNKEIEIPEGYEARIEGNKVILEPKESEDEKIRKFIVETIFRTYGDSQEYLDVLSWLEKQKEQNLSHIEGIDYEENLDLANNAIGMMRIGACYINNRTRNEVLDWLENVPKIIKQLIIKINDLEKQKERESIEDVVKKIIQNKETATKFLKSAGIMDDNGELAEMYRSEQKPVEWSEEDKTMLESCISKMANIIPVPGKHGLTNMSFEKHTDEKLAAWLKSLPERFNLQPKQEWDEEDEQCLLVCKNALSKYQRSDQWDANIISRWLENRLKPLCPQPHWKPGEEQMKALCIAIRCGIQLGTWEEDALKSLYNDLKKL